jgi:hypothetical protein
MKRPRPHYGNAFEYDRILNVFFYTSNTEKLLQARLLFMRHGYELKHFRGKKEPYDEDYEVGTIGLLNRAVQQVKEEFGVRSIFFVEEKPRPQTTRRANQFGSARRPIAACPAPFAKIFLFSRTPNQIYIPRHPVPQRGVGHRH